MAQFASTTNQGKWATVSGFVAIGIFLFNIILLQPLSLNVYADRDNPTWKEVLAVVPIILIGIGGVVALVSGILAAIKRDRGVLTYIMLVFGLLTFLVLVGGIFMGNP